MCDERARRADGCLTLVADVDEKNSEAGRGDREESENGGRRFGLSVEPEGGQAKTNRVKRAPF